MYLDIYIYVCVCVTCLLSYFPIRNNHVQAVYSMNEYGISPRLQDSFP